ncbi:conserved exported hypothetical protein [uncultured Defluviicoccus sp.]|uniref:Uncharacterized protein n=1 Tax=metagenome TaxID=256318 RepID=A0A380TDZ2_9ZZZZ|nr:conserved exported hypothetical protein [uncultured Defluviicoccus sp.]
MSNATPTAKLARQCTVASAPLLVVMLGAFFVGVSPARATVQPGGACPGRALFADPLQLYGDRMKFTVLRDGTAVGSHTVTFNRQGKDLIVDTRFDVMVEFLFMTAYSYHYAATARWRDGCLVDMRVTIHDDGTLSTVTATADNDGLKVSGPNGLVAAPLDIYPTHHWNAEVIGSAAVLNTITGRIDKVRIVDHGVEPVAINGQMLPARHYSYTGDLKNEVWYDAQGRWVKMRFEGRDGARIEYRCDNCYRGLVAQP